MNLKRIATFAIDEQSVEQSPYSWEEMFFGQLRVPAYLLAIGIGAYVVFDGTGLEWIWAWFLFVLFSTWPAIGAYWYWRVE